MLVSNVYGKLFVTFTGEKIQKPPSAFNDKTGSK